MKWIHVLLTDQRSCPNVAIFDISKMHRADVIPMTLLISAGFYIRTSTCNSGAKS